MAVTIHVVGNWHMFLWKYEVTKRQDMSTQVSTRNTKDIHFVNQQYYNLSGAELCKNDES